MAAVSDPEAVMPVTAKFSERFYARLRHEVAAERIDWFNTVDTTYHTDLERLNELNLAWFEAKLDQRAAELRSEIQRLDERMERRSSTELADSALS